VYRALVTMHSVTDRGTDGRTDDDIIMPIADHRTIY